VNEVKRQARLPRQLARKTIIREEGSQQVRGADAAMGPAGEETEAQTPVARGRVEEEEAAEMGNSPRHFRGSGRRATDVPVITVAFKLVVANTSSPAILEHLVKFINKGANGLWGRLRERCLCFWLGIVQMFWARVWMAEEDFCVRGVGGSGRGQGCFLSRAVSHAAGAPPPRASLRCLGCFPSGPACGALAAFLRGQPALPWLLSSSVSCLALFNIGMHFCRSTPDEPAPFAALLGTMWSSDKGYPRVTNHPAPPPVPGTLLTKTPYNCTLAAEVAVPPGAPPAAADVCCGNLSQVYMLWQPVAGTRVYIVCWSRVGWP
jgi:hypothetical protein